MPGQSGLGRPILGLHNTLETSHSERWNLRAGYPMISVFKRFVWRQCASTAKNYIDAATGHGAGSPFGVPINIESVKPWYGGGGRLKASIEKSEATVRQLEEVILGLERRRPLKGKSARPHKPPKAILPSHWGIVLPGDWAKSMHRGQLRGFGCNPNAMVNERPMKIALQGLHGTKDPNYSTIARKHQINRITMWRRHLGLAVSKAEATSRFHKKLTAAQEKQLLRQLEDLSDRGLATTSVLPSSSTN
ncbi:hypothetical protein CIHG_09950 [Coccidioides immitis H538.4]|uniref:Uncharacterized protein n=1 Tax=Coccidioides immitis H538.4 TaxID=396776 RepID=A0A0J8S3Y8_COCIT|nr:hypothetical protein CIHG_09950 [Coccidioides immitis H538.4]